MTLPGTSILVCLALTLSSVPGSARPDTDVAAKRAAKALTKMLRAPALKRVQVGVSVRSLDGREVAGHHSGRVMNPASGTKVLTTVAALQLLDAKTRFTTRIVGTIDADGVATTPLTIVGEGDPKLMPADLNTMAATLVDKVGLKQVSAIHVDGRQFGGDGVPPAYQQKPTAAGYRASVGAAGSHFGAVWLSLAPTRAGKRIKASVSPSVGAVELVNHATTVSKGRASIQTRVRRLQDGRTRLTVSGSLPRRQKRWNQRRRLADPNALTGYLLRAALRKLGVKGAKGASVSVLDTPSGKAVGQTLVAHSSAPMVELLKDINVWSNNYMAETVFAHLSRVGRPGMASDWKISQANVRRALEALGLEPDSFDIVNGSGLYRATRISAAAMTLLLVKGKTVIPMRKQFVESLAVSGRAGTLRRRLTGRTRGKFIGKTGTLDEVVSLSGYLTTRRGTELAVSIIVNEGNPRGTSAYRRAIDRFVRELFRKL